MMCGVFFGQSECVAARMQLKTVLPLAFGMDFLDHLAMFERPVFETFNVEKVRSLILVGKEPEVPGSEPAGNHPEMPAQPADRERESD